MAEFNPTKNYNWKATDEFVISGLELETLVKAVNSIQDTLNTPEAQNAIRTFMAYNTIQNILQRNVEADVIKESQPEA